MTTACVVFIVGVIVQIVASHSWVQFAMGRMISGLGVGALSAAVPMVCMSLMLCVVDRPLYMSYSIRQRQHLLRFGAH